VKRASLLALSVVVGYAITLSYNVLDYYSAFGIMGIGLLRSAVVRSAMWVSVLPVTALALRPLTARRHGVLVDAAALTTLCFAAAVIAELTYLMYAVGHGWYRRPGSPEQESILTIVPTMLASIHAPFTFLIGATMAARLFTESADHRAADARLNRLETRLFEARAQLLRSQLHPHFLFNSLNSVTALIRSEPQRAAEMLDRLCSFYAIASATEGRKTVRLQEELDFVRHYIDIERIRFGPRLSTHVDVAPEVADAEVPTLILQPLAENAIKHGIGLQPGPGTLAITAYARGERLSIFIEDSGAIDPSSMRDGVGLANTRERLRQLYGSDGSIAIAPIDSGTRVTVTIPLRRAA
jgi:signal transduction histidine kinase